MFCAAPPAPHKYHALTVCSCMVGGRPFFVCANVRFQVAPIFHHNDKLTTTNNRMSAQSALGRPLLTTTVDNPSFTHSPTRSLTPSLSPLSKSGPAVVTFLSCRPRSRFRNHASSRIVSAPFAQFFLFFFFSRTLPCPAALTPNTQHHPNTAHSSSTSHSRAAL